jgi:hypothetical protein
MVTKRICELIFSIIFYSFKLETNALTEHLCLKKLLENWGLGTYSCLGLRIQQEIMSRLKSYRLTHQKLESTGNDLSNLF